jgi:2-keto-4-pentenoate hydratase/2-oxohepta-3-ene-1,7-dioic acid hydratase in catechol pathway
MQLVTFLDSAGKQAAARVGVVVLAGKFVVDLAAVAASSEGNCPHYLADMIALFEGGPRARDHVERLVEIAKNEADAGWLRPREAIRLLAPVPRPCSIRDCMSFERHLINAMRTVTKWRFRPLAAMDRALARPFGKGFLCPPKVWYERPLYYKGNPRSVVGPEADIRWPAFTEKLDFELELGVFIGREGRNLAPSEALEYVAGYTIFNDFSARDVQLEEMQGRLGPAKGKDFDTGNVIGPYLVTADEIPDPDQLSTAVRINGEEWSRSSTRELQHSFGEMIAFISQEETLYPGDFLAAGTVPGGCGLELDRWIQPDDEVELEIERLGTLRNRVVRTNS